MVLAFCDQVVAIQAVELCTGKRNLNISLNIVREKCTGRFYIVFPVANFQPIQLYLAALAILAFPLITNPIV